MWKKSFLISAATSGCFKLPTVQRSLLALTWRLCRGRKKSLCLWMCTVWVQHYVVPSLPVLKCHLIPSITICTTDKHSLTSQWTFLRRLDVWLASERSKDCRASQTWSFERIIERGKKMKRSDTECQQVLYSLSASHVNELWDNCAIICYFPVLFLVFAAASQQEGCLFISRYETMTMKWKLN